MQTQSWEAVLEGTTDERARAAIQALYAGQQRFLTGRPRCQGYTTDQLKEIATNQQPIAAIVACSDSRVSPEIVFDQPLGAVFASRVPGNVASDSAKWMLDLAVAELHVPVVIVLGHTRCLAVGQMVDGKIGGPGGVLRFDVQKAVHRARRSGVSDVYRAAVEENVKLTVENLLAESMAVQKAMSRNELRVLGGVYDMDSGEVQLLA